jgi:hypothetical protein
MPRLSVFMLRTALIHLGIGFTLGALLLSNKGIPYALELWRLLLPHVEFVLFGWTMQLMMGVAFWILPRHTHEPRYGAHIRFSMLESSRRRWDCGQTLSR